MSEARIELSGSACAKKRKTGEGQGKVYELEITGTLPHVRNVIILGGKK